LPSTVRVLTDRFSGHCGRPAGVEPAAFYILYFHSADEAQRKAVTTLELLIPEKMLAVWPENKGKEG